MQAIDHCSQLKLDLNIVVGIIKIFIPIDKREMPGQRKTYVVQPSSRWQFFGLWSYGLEI